jgi:hypothetical protein
MHNNNSSGSGSGARVIDFNKAKKQSELHAGRIDADDLRAEINHRAREFIEWLFPSCVVVHKSGRYAVIGDIYGSPGESLEIQLTGPKAGYWNDFASDPDGGRDLLSLFMASNDFTAADFPRALEIINSEFLNNSVPAWTPRKFTSVFKQRADQHKDKPRPNINDRPLPSESYYYRDVAGNVIAIVRRYEYDEIDPATGKHRKSFSVWDARAGKAQAPTPRPLYRLPELARLAQHDEVVFVEGERKADVLASAGIQASSIMFGSSAPLGEVDWTPIAGRKVIVWPDKDESGFAFAKALAEHLTHLGCKVFGIDPPDDVKTKWDVVDCIAEGRDPHDVIAGAKPVNPEQSSSQSSSVKDVWLFDPWERYIVPEFPLRVLPKIAQRYVMSQSVVMGCDPSALAMAALTAFSGALDHRFAVKMMRSGNWWEHPRLWTLLVGDPSRKKTPIINDVTRPLERHQTALRRNYAIELQAYETAKQNKDDSVAKPDPPVRYVIWDTTTEKLGEILSRNDHGLLVKRDEFSGWIGGMEKYSSSCGAGADRGFWLQAFDGGPHAVDRIGRGEIYINNLSVSLIGGIQPAKLAELHGLTSDGLLQRFLPVMMRASSLARDCESGDEQEDYQRLVYKLIAARDQRLFLSDRALTLMNGLREHLHNLEHAAAGLADGLQAFVGKLPGIAGRLAVILHMAANPENAPREIETTTVADVRTLIIDFILPHAVEFYRSTEELTDGERLRKIASWILTSQQNVVASRDLIRNVGCLRGVSVLDLQTCLSPLVAAGWLEPTGPGPVNRAWAVNPKVAAQFERQRQTEEERKALAAGLMGSPRKAT